jgi:electron transport complex protein RnfG
MLTLGAIAAVSAIIMAFVYNLTKDAIEEARRMNFLAGLNAVLPEYDNFPDQDFVMVNGNIIYIAKKDGQIVGYATEGRTNKGYSGELVVIVGVLPNSTIYGVRVVRHLETPGLGDKVTKLSFLDLFRGKPISNVGHIDNISGATISVQAVIDAVKAANAIIAKGIEDEY